MIEHSTNGPTLIIDEDLKALTRVADRHYVIVKGRVVWSGASAELARNREVQHRYLASSSTFERRSRIFGRR